MRKCKTVCDLLENCQNIKNPDAQEKTLKAQENERSK